MSMVADYDVFDAHHHVGDASALLGRGPSGSAPAVDADEMRARLAIMDRGGVRQALVIPGHGYLRPNGHADTQAMNDRIARYREANLARFPVALGIVEPLSGEIGLAEIERCRDSLGLAGVSFHCRYQGVSTDHYWVARYVEHLGACGLLPVIHALDESAEESLWKVGQLADRFPDITMLIFDGYSTYEGTKLSGVLAERHPNLLFDTAAAFNSDLIIEHIKRHGAHRYVFGTDLYSPPFGKRISHVLGELVESDLDDAQKRAVVGGTARALFGLSA